MNTSNTLRTAWSTDAKRWAAVTERRVEADGAFFFAVRTTGVFCRPSCASRPPRRENVEFFDTADDARAAGYRDCKRCQPGRLPRDIEIVNRACAALDADPQQRVTLAQLGEAVHVLEALSQRLGKRESPYRAVFDALVALAGVRAEAQVLAALLAEPEDNPDDLDALDRQWAEQAVTFGPGEAGCPKAEALVAAMQADEPAPRRAAGGAD